MQLNEQISIEEPPVQKINRRGACLKKTCGTSCGCLLFLILIIFGLIQWAGWVSKKALERVPEEITATFPIYNAEEVSHISKKLAEKNSLLGRVAYYIPERTRKAINYSGEDSRLRYTLTWNNLSTSADFIVSFYKTELEKKEFGTHIDADTAEYKQLSFTQDNLEGVLIINDDPETAQTEQVTLTIVTPPGD